VLSNDQISLWDYPIAEIYKVIFSIQLFTEQCFLRLAICCLLFLLQPIFPRFTIGFARFCTCVPRKHLCGLLGEIFTGSRFQKLHLPLKKCDPINETSKSKQFSVQKNVALSSKLSRVFYGYATACRRQRARLTCGNVSQRKFFLSVLAARLKQTRWN